VRNVVKITEEEIFHVIEKAVIEGVESGEISCYSYRYELPPDARVVILDKWKGRLAKKLKEVVE
jgi:hypothetical protein